MRCQLWIVAILLLFAGCEPSHEGYVTMSQHQELQTRFDALSEKHSEAEKQLQRLEDLEVDYRLLEEENAGLLQQLKWRREDKTSNAPKTDSKQPSRMAKPDDAQAAYTMAIKFVKDKLKAPASAKFPGYTEREKQVLDEGNRTFVVVSWVDSQNTFGAMIRQKFVAKVRELGDDRWKLEEIYFE